MPAASRPLARAWLVSLHAYNIIKRRGTRSCGQERAGAPQGLKCFYHRAILEEAGCLDTARQVGSRRCPAARVRVAQSLADGAAGASHKGATAYIDAGPLVARPPLPLLSLPFDQSRYVLHAPLGMPIRAASWRYCCVASALVRAAKIVRQTMRRRTFAVCRQLRALGSARLTTNS